ncbi:hypothetical protein PSU4_58190 [Pseudonocardia sulfidoxydans NBRC 16205]|uniref:glycerol kinase n=2 Tax=Pseudonocardia sulfidoxydans TaxID=54011 RepID=A0A511DPX1_9PSEU|nr:hypothetical protein PSU4_58190 [Pseudonocardia sulfidoxydans NBRC 16205]
MLMDLSSLDWHDQLLDLFEVPRAMLPQIVPNTTGAGPISEFGGHLRIDATIGDQQSSLLGQACLDAGDVKCTYGTGGFMLQNTGTLPVASNHGLLTTVAFQEAGRPASYALEGPLASAGSMVTWLQDGLGLINSAPEIEDLAMEVADNGGCYFVPAFSGLLSPHWDGGARGMIVGLTAYAKGGHLARAVLEACAFQTLDVARAIVQDSGVPLDRLRVDGGMTSNMLLMQTIADVLNRPVERGDVSESVALGAAYAAGIATEVWSDKSEIQRNWRLLSEWEPRLGRDWATEYWRWRDAVERSMTRRTETPAVEGPFAGSVWS